MNSYFFEYWYRYSVDQKDFEQVTVVSETEEEAREQVKEMKRWIYCIKLLSINKEKKI